MTGGIDAVSLRAIARDMGMTAPAIYRYFPSLEALVAAARRRPLRRAAAAAGGGPRRRAGAEPVEPAAGHVPGVPRLVRGAPRRVRADLRRPEPGDSHTLLGDRGGPEHPGARFGAVFIQPILDLWHRSPFPTPPPELLRRRLGGQRLQPLRHHHHGDVPVQVAYASLSGWTRLYGLVAMEVFHRLDWAVTDTEALFELELETFTAQLLAGPPPGDDPSPTTAPGDDPPPASPTTDHAGGPAEG